MARLLEGERRALHAAAWRWLDASEDIDEAVGQAVLADNAQAAAEMVQGCAHDLLAKGELGQLAGLMRRLPPAEIAARFGLHVITAYLQMYAGEIGALTQSIQQMESHSEPLDPRQRYALALLRGGLALQRDDTDSVVALLPELQRVSPDADDFAHAGRSNILSWMFIHRGEYEQARKVLEESALHGGAPRGMLLGRCMSGMTHVAEGQVVLAERVFFDVLAEAEQHGRRLRRHCVHGRGVARRGALRAERCRGLMPAARKADRGAGAHVDTGHGVAGAGRARERALVRRTQDRGKEWLERLEDYAQGHGVDRLLANALCLRSRWLLEEGRSMTGSRVVAARSARRTLLGRDAQHGLGNPGRAPNSRASGCACTRTTSTAR